MTIRGRYRQKRHAGPAADAPAYRRRADGRKFWLYFGRIFTLLPTKGWRSLRYAPVQHGQPAEWEPWR